jgi:hypothetical protein
MHRMCSGVAVSTIPSYLRDLCVGGDRLSCFTLHFVLNDSKHKPVLTQHSLNCLASIGDVKLRPHVSLVIGSFQYTKHSDAWPIRVPVTTVILRHFRKSLKYILKLICMRHAHSNQLLLVDTLS